MRIPRARWTVCLVFALTVAACSPASSLNGPGVISVGYHPFSAVALGDGSLLVSLSRGRDMDGALAVVHADGSMARLPLRLAGAPAGIAMSHDRRLIAVAADRETLVLDHEALLANAENPVRARISDQNGAIYAAFSPDDRVLAISEEWAGQVILLPLGQPGRETQEITVARAPVGLAFSPDGDWLYATSEIDLGGQGGCRAGNGRDVAPGTVATIALRGAAGAHLVTTAEVGCSPVRIILSADGARAFVSLRGQDAVGVYETAALLQGEGRPESLVDAGSAPVGLALSPDGTSLHVANSNRFGNGNGSLACFAVDPHGHLTARGSIPSGTFPRELSVLDDGRMAATVYGDGQIQIVTSRC